MFTEVFPSETSKPNTGADPRYLASIQMGEGQGAGWDQEREERDRHKGFDLRHKAECLYPQERRQIQHSKVISALILCKPRRLILFVFAMNQGQGFLWGMGKVKRTLSNASISLYTLLSFPQPLVSPSHVTH